ncbi:MAG: type II secretion system minor pseudopilin GspJ [Pseudomonadota bacterium]
MSRQHGFSLLELLVAVAVFAAVSAIAYSGLHSVLETRQQTNLHAERLQSLQRTMLTLQRDLSQAVDRPVRDQFGDEEPSLFQDSTGEYLLVLTRAGRANPLGLRRSGLRRVAYRLDEGRLERHLWRGLDHSQGAEPFPVVLLERVRDVELRYLDADNAWQDAWPPLDAEEGQADRLPRAVEVVLELEEWGQFRRLIPLPPGPEPVAPPGVEEGAE